MSFEAVKKIYSQDLFSQSSVQKEPLGLVRVLEDGREFVYAKAGAGGAAAGSLYQAPAVLANHASGQATAAVTAIGAKRISVTLGATAATANQYAGGFIFITNDTGQGHVYKVRSHAAIGSGGTGYVYLHDAVRVALDATSDVTLYSPWNGVVIHTSIPTATLVGVPQIAVTANYYAWFQKRGLCNVLTQGTVVAGDGVIASTTVDGAVAPEAADTSTGAKVGICGFAGGDGNYSIIDLRL